MTQKQQLAQTLLNALSLLGTEFADVVDVPLERPRDFAHGDYASPLAMQLAKKLKKNPRELAVQISEIWKTLPEIASAVVAGPGFINLSLASGVAQQVVLEVLAAGAQYGQQVPNQKSEKIVLEFVSANPTGPLHVGHGRQGVLGDTLANLLQSQGQQVQREFYYNDAGVQIYNLALSVQARARGITPEDPHWPSEGYRGQYILDIAEQFLVQADSRIEDLEAIRHFAVAYLRAEQDRDLQALGVSFDHFYLESSLYQDGKVNATVARLELSGKTFIDGGALWLRTTDYGDDKDRVMRKSDGSYTYFVPDVAYHEVKWQRGFQRAINIQGSDHHGTIARVRAGLQALNEGIPQNYPDYVLHKMVTVMKGGAEVKISKRAGSYVTLRDLIEWSGEGDPTLSEAQKIEKGRDAVRFFLSSRKADTEFVFDIDLALAQGEDNPVYYVQYAHARINALLRNYCAIGQIDIADIWQHLHGSLALQALPELTSPTEVALLHQLADFPEVLTRGAQELAPHHLNFYLRDLAGALHSYYNNTRILVSPDGIKQARLLLMCAVQQVLSNGLSLLGVRAPLFM